MNFFYIGMAISSVIAVLLLVIYLVVSRSGNTEEELSTDDAYYKKALKVLEEARLSSLKIVRDANEKALHTLEGSNVFNQNLSSEMEGSLKDMSQRQIDTLEALSNDLFRTYEQAINTEKQKNIDTIHSASETLKEEILNEVGEFKATLHKETVDSQNLVEQELKKEYDSIRQELQKYKEEQYKKIDSMIYDVTILAAKKVIGKSLDLDNQQDLVLESLEEAKKQGVFRQ